MEYARVGRFMPGPSAARPSERQISITNQAAVSEHPIKMSQIVRSHSVAIAKTAVVSVVKEQHIIARCPMPADASHQLRRIPFMNNNHLRITKSAVQIKILLVVERAV